MIECHALIPENSTTTKTVTSRKFKNIDYTVFMDDIKFEVIHFTNNEETVRILNAELLRVLGQA